MTYALENAWEAALRRLHCTEQAYDAHTERCLEATGLGPGWRCLEVGAGAGSIARFLAERAGPAGSVLATDIDPRHLRAIEGPGLRVLGHDVTRDELPEGDFDLAHARLVLGHWPPPVRAAALARLAGALRPGGRLLVEDFDQISSHAEGGPYLAVLSAVRAALERAGADTLYGRKQRAELRAAGLADVRSEGHVIFFRGGSPFATLFALAFEQLRPRLLEHGLAERDLDGAIGQLSDPSFEAMGPVLVSTWGRRPPGQSE